MFFIWIVAPGAGATVEDVYSRVLDRIAVVMTRVVFIS